MNSYQILHLAPMFAALLLAAVIDWRSRRIPNWLTFSLAASGFAAALLPGSDLSALQALIGFGVGFAIPFCLFALGALGGGDVKLLAAVGAWVGGLIVLKIFLAAAVVGMVIVLAQSARQGRLGILFRNSALLTMNIANLNAVGMQNLEETGKSCRSVDRPLPYAVPVLAASLLVSLLG